MHSNPNCLLCLQCMETYQSGGMTEKLFHEGNMIHAVLSRDPEKRTAVAYFLSSQFLLFSNLSAVRRLPEDTLHHFPKSSLSARRMPTATSNARVTLFW